MKFEIEGSLRCKDGVRVGNVYRARGGMAGKRGHMYIVVAVTKKKFDRYGFEERGGSACCLVVDLDGDIRGTTSYGVHYLEELKPCGFVPDLEQVVMGLTIEEAD